MWKFELLNWQGTRIGEITNAQNVRLNFGLSKNSNLYFETTLQSPLGKTIANEDYLAIAAYRRHPDTGNLVLQFVGPIITKEEIGENSTPTIAVNAIGAYWRLSKRLINNNKNEGRTERGAPIAPTPAVTIIACDTGNNRLAVFDEATTNWVKNIGSAGTGDGQFNAPRGIVVDRTDNSFYVLDSGNRRIQKFNADGSFNKKFGTSTDIGVGARGITLDRKGKIWIGDTASDSIKRFDPATGLVDKTVAATTTARLESIYDINAYEDRVIVSDIGTTYRHGIQAFNIDTGAFLGKQVGDSLDRNYRSWAPSSIKTTTPNTVFGTSLLNYFSNTFNLATTAEFSGNIVSPAFLDGAFANTPHHIATRPRGGNLDYVYVAYTASNRSAIFVYSLDEAPANQAGIPQFVNPIKRIGGTSGTGNGQMSGAEYFDYQVGTAITGVQAIVTAINTTNSQDGGSWIYPASTQGTSPTVSINYNTWGGYKKISDAIEDLSGNLEWKVIPKLENTGSNAVKFGEWYADEVLGTNKSSIVNFEYGTARLNVKQYSIKQSLENLTNQAAYPAAGYKPYAVVSKDEASINDIGLFEDVVSGGVIMPVLRQELADLYIRLRKTPRVLVEIQPVRSDVTSGLTVPIPMIDYEPGDFLGIVIKDDGDERINGEVRLYDIEISLDNSGKEETTLKLYIDGD